MELTKLRLTFWASTVLALFALVAIACAQQTVAPFKTQQANTDFYVNMGNTTLSTIQKTVTAACAYSTATTVIILPGSNPADTIGGLTSACTSTGIIDRRVYPAVSYTCTSGACTPGNISVPAINPFNPFLALGLSQASGTASNYVQRDASGNILNTTFPEHTPWTLTQYDWQGYGCCDQFLPLNVTLNLQGGEINAVGYNGNISLFSKTLNMQASGQNGGADQATITQNSPGDFIDSTKVVLGRGHSRGYDESGEMKRWFIAINNATFGGNATIKAVDAQGNQPFQLANPGTYGYSFLSSGEEMPFVDIGAKWTSPGNIQNVASWPTNHNYIEITGDAGSNITSTYGVSSYATLTQAITGDIYTGTCPTWTDTSTTPPGGTTFITDRAGVNSYAAANPGLNSPANYCVSIGTTTGTALSVGTTVYIADSNFPPEYVTVKSIVDANHFTAYMKHPHAVGSYVTWGGGVGYGLSSANDDRPVGTSSTAENAQTAITHLVYPILMTEASNKVVVDVIGLGGSDADFKSLAYANNAPVAPLTITIDASGNVTASNANTTADYRTANWVGTGHVAGPLETAPPPALTFTCTSNPTIKLTPATSTGNSEPTYVPTTTATGSGCTGVTVTATAPNPFNVYPMTWTYRVTDPALTDKTVWSTSGYILTDPLAAPSAWHANDQVESTRWWQSYAGSGQESYQQDDDVARSGDSGTRNNVYYSGVQTGLAAFNYTNLEPVAHYIGKYTNPGGYGTSATPSDASIIPGPLFELSNANAGLTTFDTPPMPGHALLQVNCIGTLNDPLKDAPCLHGIFATYNIWGDTENGSLDFLKINAASHVLSTGDTFSADHFNATGAGTSAFNATTVTSLTASAASSFNAGLIAKGGGNAGFSNLIFNNASSTNIQFGICNIFDAGGALCAGNPHGSVTNGSDTFYAADGDYWTGKLEVSTSAQVNGLSVGLGIPVPYPVWSYSGAAGSINLGYYFEAKNALGQVTPGGFFVANANTAALSVSNTATITCPTALQNGYPAGTTYELIRYNITGGLYTDLGTCPLSGNVTDNGSNVTTFTPSPRNATALADVGSIAVGGSQSLTGVQGTTGTKVLVCTGTFTTGHLVSVDVNGNCTDGGAAPVLPPAITTGTATLASGTFTVNTSAAVAAAGGHYLLTNCGAAGTAIGTLSVGTVTVGTSFVINSMTATNTVATGDTSTVCWWIR